MDCPQVAMVAAIVAMSAMVCAKKIQQNAENRCGHNVQTNGRLQK